MHGSATRPPHQVPDTHRAEVEAALDVLLDRALEPIVDMEGTAPSRCTGARLGALNTKRARVENQDSLPGDLAVIQCKVPLAEVTRPGQREHR